MSSHSDEAVGLVLPINNFKGLGHNAKPDNILRLSGLAAVTREAVAVGALMSKIFIALAKVELLFITPPITGPISAVSIQLAPWSTRPGIAVAVAVVSALTIVTVGGAIA